MLGVLGLFSQWFWNLFLGREEWLRPTVFPSAARNPSSTQKPRIKEGFLTPQTPFGMTCYVLFKHPAIDRGGLPWLLAW